jgi:hypothetical protein
MKTASRALVVVGALLQTGCATQGYLLDRARDGMDVLTVTTGVGAAGQVRVGPLPLGFAQCCDMVGLRGGQLIHRTSVPEIPEEINTTAPLVGLFLLTCMAEDPRPEVLSLIECEDGFSPDPLQELRHKADEGLCVPAMYQLEALFGLGGTLRLGINAGEFVDFLLGWTSIDIFDDDLERRAAADAPDPDVRPGRPQLASNEGRRKP